MNDHHKIHVLFFILVTVLLSLLSHADEETEANIFLSLYNHRGLLQAREKLNAVWHHATNINQNTFAAKALAEYRYSVFQEEARVNASRFDLSKLSKDTKRKLSMIITGTVTVTNRTKQRELIDILCKMEDVYSLSRVTHPLIGQGLSLYPDLLRIMRKSRNVSVLLTAWQQWRAVNGPKIRPLYNKFVQLSNEAAKDNHWEDTGSWWRSWYETETLENDLETLWLELKPFYMELHGYVRYRLQEQYPAVIDTQPLPAHILGNMWSQSWTNIYSLVEPYHQAYNPDLTSQLLKKQFNAKKILQFAESFFVSIGLGKLPDNFYSNSLLEKPKEPRQVDCQPSAWDLYYNKKLQEHDVRIKQCTSISYDDLITAHRELGRIYYSMGYTDQPYIYRAAANPAFSEALGDAMFLSVETPQHLVSTKLLDDYKDSKEAEMNALMMSALHKVAFLPFSYLVDQWRWQVFQGDIKPSEYNKKWWQLRTRYQGIKPPSSRDETSFDPGAKYHIPANIPYIRYFISTVLQFQFHKAACEAIGFNGPLHRCSIYGSNKAGDKIRTMINAGKSKHWREILKHMTGCNDGLNTRPLKEYYEPLRDWLLKQRCQLKYAIGWSGSPGPAYNPCHPPNFLPPTKRTTIKPITSQGRERVTHCVIQLVVALLTSNFLHY